MERPFLALNMFISTLYKQIKGQTVNNRLIMSSANLCI